MLVANSEQDQDSWECGTNGSTSQDVKLALLDNLPVRHSVHLCNGGLKCELFDAGLLEGYEHKDAEDMSKTREIFQAEQHRNETDGSTVLSATETFVVTLCYSSLTATDYSRMH
jgi:hypothetical protein